MNIRNVLIVVCILSVILLGDVIFFQNMLGSDSSSRTFLVLSVGLVLAGTIMASSFFCTIFSKQKLSFDYVFSSQKITDLSANVQAYTKLFGLIGMFGLQVLFVIQSMKYYEQNLEKNGITVPIVVIDRQEEFRKGNSQGFYIYYQYRYENKTYQYRDRSDVFYIGDTIQLKFDPENPSNHEVLENKIVR